MINKDIIEKELKKITNKKIKVKVNSNKKRGVYSWVRRIEFNGSIDFDLTELDGVLAHEIVHIEEKHVIKLFSLILSGIIIAIISYIFLPLIIKINIFYILSFILTVLIISVIILSRRFERIADKKAAEKVGKVPIIRALEKIGTWEEMRKYDLVHDKLRKRIDNIKKLDLPDFIELK